MDAIDVNPPLADMEISYPEIPRFNALKSDWATPRTVCANEEPDNCEMPCIKPETAAVAFKGGGELTSGSALVIPADAIKPVELVSPFVDVLVRLISAADSPLI